MAAGVAVAVTLWMLSGLGSSPVEFSTETGFANDNGEPMLVRVEQIRSSDVEKLVTVSARTEPNRFVRLKTETDGAVVSLGAERGSPVSAGETIVELDLRDRMARLTEANSLVVQRELELEGRKNLRSQQFASQVELAEGQNRLDSALSAKERISLEIQNTSIIAPFDGLVQERNVEIGDFVRIGDAVVDIVDIDPLIIAGEINGKEISELRVGGTGSAKLVDGTVLVGTIRYLAPVADENTRTFRVELAVENSQTVRAGLTAELQLAGSRIAAHDISPSLLTLADDGTIGIKAVNALNRVLFYPIEIVGSSDDGILVTGLPESVRVITVGQGFVTVGQEVNPSAYSVLEDNSSYERAN